MSDGIDPVNPSELMLRILEQIRDELRTTRTDLGARIDGLREDLSTRIDQTNARLEVVEHTLVDLATQQRATVTYLREHVAADLVDLRTRVSVLEAKAG